MFTSTLAGSGRIFTGMSGHQHADHSWRVAIVGGQGGAGVLLDARHVLTCAHVVGDKDRQVTVYSAVGRPGWHASARVVPGSWAYQEGDPPRGDVALLELDRPAACDAHATLWRAPVSGGRVREVNSLIITVFSKEE